METLPAGLSKNQNKEINKLIEENTKVLSELYKGFVSETLDSNREKSGKILEKIEEKLEDLDDVISDKLDRILDKEDKRVTSLAQALNKGFSEKLGGIQERMLDKLFKPLTFFTGFTGKDYLDMKRQSKKDKLKNYLTKKISGTINEQAVKKGGENAAPIGTLLINKTLEDIFKDKKKGEDKDLDFNLGGGLAGMGGALKGILGKAGPIAMLAGGLIWAISDAVAGVMRADEWGVSKISAGIGGFLGGDAKGGMMNAFKNAGKWALIGAGIGGLTAGPAGMLAGGLIGAAFGGIMGFIGAEKLAKLTDKLGGKFKPLFDKVSPIFMGYLDTLGQTFGNLINNLFEGFSNFVESGKLEDIFKGTGIFGGILNIMTKPLQTIAQPIIDIAGFILNVISDPEKTLKKVFTDIGNFFSGIVKGAQEFAQDPLAFIKKAVSGMFQAISDFFTGITDSFSFIVGKMSDGKGGINWAKAPEVIGAVLGGGDDKWKNQSAEYHRAQNMVRWLQGRATAGSPMASSLLNKSPSNSDAISLIQGAGLNASTYQGFSMLMPEDQIKMLNQFNSTVAGKITMGGELAPKFHTGGKAYKEQIALLRQNEMVLAPNETSAYTRYLVDKEFGNASSTIDTSIDFSDLIKAVKDLGEELKQLKGTVINQQTVVNRYSPTSIMNSMGAV